MYIGATEISLLLPAHVSIGTNTDPVSLGEVASMIVEISADLDLTAAGGGYIVPITPSSPVSYAAFQLATKQGVGARILGIIFPNIGGQADKTSLGADYRDAYKAFKDGLAKKIFVLPDAPESIGGGRALPRSYSTSAGAGAPDSGASPMVPINWEP